MKTLIHHDGALGDVLLSLACIRKLREGGEVLHFAGRNDIGRLLRDSGAVGEASDSSDRRYGELYGGKGGRDLGTFLARFDRAVVFTVDAGNLVITALREAIADTKVVITAPPSGARISAARYRLGQLDADAGMESGPFLSVPPAHGAMAAAMLLRWGWRGDRPLVMVHPGSGGRAKRWPLDRFFSVIKGLGAEQELFVVIATGPEEDDLFLDRVETFCRSQEGAVHAGDADLSALMALLEPCSVYVGNDSGVSHLAAAAGTPTIALFGPTDPLVWGPVGRRVSVISADSLADISVAQVSDVVREALADAASAGRGRGPQDL